MNLLSDVISVASCWSRSHSFSQDIPEVLSLLCVFFWGGQSSQLTSSFLVKAMCASPAPSFFMGSSDSCLFVAVVVTAVFVQRKSCVNSFAPLSYSDKNAVLSWGFHVVHFWQTFRWNSSLTHNWLLLLAAHGTSTLAFTVFTVISKYTFTVYIYISEVFKKYGKYTTK